MPAPTPQPHGAGRTASVIVGAIVGFIAVGLLIAGGVVLWANSKKDHDGYISTHTERFSSSSYAIATDNLDAKIDAPDWVVNPDHYGKIRLKVAARNGKPVFVGVAPTHAVDDYLARTAHETVTDIDYNPFHASYSYDAGTHRPGVPADQGIWVASAHGAGKQTLTWNVHRGSWSIVVMNADGSAGVDAGVSAGARLPFLVWVGWGAVGGGLLLLVVAGSLMFVGLRAPRPATVTAGSIDPQPSAA